MQKKKKKVQRTGNNTRNLKRNTSPKKSVTNIFREILKISIRFTKQEYDAIKEYAFIQRIRKSS